MCVETQEWRDRACASCNTKRLRHGVVNLFSFFLVSLSERSKREISQMVYGDRFAEPRTTAPGAARASFRSTPPRRVSY